MARFLSNVRAVGAVARETLIAALPRRPQSLSLYAGFGAIGRVLVMGRALRDEPLPEAAASDTPWKNLLAMLRRADADAIPRARVRVHGGAQPHEFTTDDEGFFSGWMDADESARLDDEWIRIHAELVQAPGAPETVRADGRAYYPAFTPAQLVISDIDDTVLESKVTNLLQAARTIAFGNARTRLPFPGVAAFYRALRRGGDDAARNPLFYVSSSPWNLYDVIAQFLDIQDIPSGPIMLRDVDLGLDTLSSRHHHTHKREMIRRVLTTYPAVPAILIGDSSQQDPEIYRDAVRDFAGRIRAVYIRNVTMTTDRAHAIETLAKEIMASQSSLVFADDTLAAARHAAEHGYISSSALDSIGHDKRADEGAEPGKTPPSAG